MTARILGCALAVLLTSAAQAQVTTLTFDDLDRVNSWYGDGNSILPSMRALPQSLVYFEQGYWLTYVTPSAASYKSHISDGASVPFTFNWHTGFDNGPDGYVVLTRGGGGKFTLLSFNYWADDTIVTAGASSASLVGSGQFSTPFVDVTSVVFTAQGFGFNTGLDNIQISAVPEASTWAVLLAGFAALGAFSLRAKSRRVEHAGEIAG